MSKLDLYISTYDGRKENKDTKENNYSNNFHNRENIHKSSIEALDNLLGGEELNKEDPIDPLMSLNISNSLEITNINTQLDNFLDNLAMMRVKRSNELRHFNNLLSSTLQDEDNDISITSDDQSNSDEEDDNTGIGILQKQRHIELRNKALLLSNTVDVYFSSSQSSIIPWGEDLDQLLGLSPPCNVPITTPTPVPTPTSASRIPEPLARDLMPDSSLNPQP